MSFKLPIAILASSLFAAGSAIADPVDPLFSGFSVEGSAGYTFGHTNLDDPLTVLNNTATPVLSTDEIDDVHGYRTRFGVSAGFMSDNRIFADLTLFEHDEDYNFTPAVDSSFPGSFDDGYRLVPGNEVETDQDSQGGIFRLGYARALGYGFSARGFAQIGRLSDDFEFEVGSFDRRVTADGENGVYGLGIGASYFRPITESFGIRLNADVAYNHYDFDYTYRNTAAGVLDQSIDDSADLDGFSAQVSLEAEQTFSSGFLIGVEAGVDIWDGLGSGTQTFLDPAGTATTANIQTTTLVAPFISAKVGFRF